jgi:SRSO17 transposase
MQRLFARARRDSDLVRDDLRGYVTGHLGDEDAVLVVDETGDLKKGTRTAGVQRQYTGTAGRIENTQVAVYLTYATRAGHALIDRALYLPRSWAGDRARRAAAGVPQDAEFATKPALARQMIIGALDGGAAARWVAGDEVYGADPGLRRALEGLRDRICAGCCLQPPGHHRRRAAARRCHRPQPAPPGLAAAVRRPGLQGPPLL